MGNKLYNRGANFNPDELADGDAIEAEFDAVSRGFDTIEDLVDANKAGYPTKTFHVATATEATHAVPKAQMEEAIELVNYTATDVLEKLNTVGGSGSWLDADLLDGKHGSYYLDVTNFNTGKLAKERLPESIDANTTGNAATASKLLSAITLSLSGGASGSLLFDGSTNVTLNVTILSDSAEVGKVTAFARKSAPPGHLKCNGAAISRTTYAALFAAIGTTFGSGDGSTTFNIPDFRSETIRGWDDGRGIDTGRVFGSWQDGQNLSHTHDATVSSDAHNHSWSGVTSSDTHNHTYTYRGGSFTSQSSGSSYSGTWYSTSTATSSSDTHSHTVSGTTDDNSHTHTVTNASSGGSEARVRNIALLYCIKY